MRDPEGISAAISRAESVCICGHVNPDGDTIGGILAMRLILQNMGKHVRVFCQDRIPDQFRFLPGAEEIRRPEDNTENFDLFLAVDVSDAARLGTCSKLMDCCTESAQIDHHGTNIGYLKVNSIDGNAAAACVMIWDQMQFFHMNLTEEIAVCLYTGISTDTGNFSYDCTNAEAFRAMSCLSETGFPLAELNMRLFRERSVPQLKLLGRAIESLRFEADGKIAVMQLTEQDFTDSNALPDQADKIENYGLETKGVIMAVLAREDQDGKIKYSLRARQPMTVDEVAVSLGGGGHPRAAGISIEGTLAMTLPRVLEKMKTRLDRKM